MDRTDLLEDVLATTDSLHGVVLSWPYKPSHERYLEICKNFNYPVYKNIATIIHRKTMSNFKIKIILKKVDLSIIDFESMSNLIFSSSEAVLNE